MTRVTPAQARLAVNWVDMAQFALSSPDGVAAYRRELNIADGAVVALYSGNMGGLARRNACGAGQLRIKLEQPCLNQESGKRQLVKRLHLNQFIVQFGFGLPKIIFALHIQPKLGTVAKQGT